MRRPPTTTLRALLRALLAPLFVTAALVGLVVTDQAWADVEDRRLLVHVRQSATDPPPASARDDADCAPPAEVAVPAMVGSIFRCRLTEAGYAPDQVRTITAEAVVVAECESHFDPSAVVFDGRYRESGHPRTGDRYTGAGVFQFVRKTADRWIVGGYANVEDPVANIDAAARVYISNVARGFPGWSDWACAAANDGFRATSVLPGWPGGPASLPAWAFDH